MSHNPNSGMPEKIRNPKRNIAIARNSPPRSRTEIKPLLDEIPQSEMVSHTFTNMNLLAVTVGRRRLLLLPLEQSTLLRHGARDPNSSTEETRIKETSHEFQSL
jgi:hypothetical protein